MSILCEAARNGNLDEVKNELTNGADIDHRLENGQSALFLAVQNGHKKVVEYLLDANACLSFPIRSGVTIRENWEVFTQVFKNFYPNGISKISENHLDIAKLLSQQDLKHHRPLLYEALYCSLGLLWNPISIYCVGLYALISCENVSQRFTEETFLFSLCNSFDDERIFDFLNTIHMILSISKAQLKKVTGIIAQCCCWGTIMKDLINKNAHKSHLYLLPLSRIFNILLSNINIKNMIVSQLEMVDRNDVKILGALIRRSIYNGESTDYNVHDEEREILMKTIWKFLLNLLKYYLKSEKVEFANNLMMNDEDENDGFIDEIISRSLEDDIEVCHLLIDNNTQLSGKCFVKAIQFGCIDVVERFKNDNSVIFSQEADNFLISYSALKRVSSRNVKLCVKILRRSRKKLAQIELELRAEEEEMKRYEKFDNHKKQEQQQDEKVEVEQLNDYRQVEKISTTVDKKTVIDETQSDTDINIVTTPRTHHKKKKRKKKKRCFSESNVPLYMSRTQPEEEEENNEETNNKKNNDDVDDVIKEVDNNVMMSSIDVTTSSHDIQLPSTVVGGGRRRRVSSSSSISSECSGDENYQRKSVSFSHPISVSKKIDEVDDQAAAKKKNEEQPRHHDDEPTPRSCLRLVNNDDDDDVITRSVHDDDVSTTGHGYRWEARFDDMRSINEGKLKHVTWSDGDDVVDDDDDDDVIDNKFVKFSLEQHHLLVGHGGMFSSVYLGITDENREVAVKKSNSRKADLLAESTQSDKLLKLEKHPNIIQYYDVIREKPNYYLISELGEYSLDQVFTSHSIFHLPSPISTCLLQLTNGLSFLHQHDILHRSIRPSNVLIGRDGMIKLSDYGLHSSATYHMTNIPIPIKCWVSYEILKSKTMRIDLFTKESDISSLGMIFYYICTSGGHPFGDLSTSSENCLANLQRGSYNLKTLLSSPYEHHLIKNMIFKEPEKRFSIEQMLNHPYFMEKSIHVKRLQQMMDIYGRYKSYVTDLLQASSREILQLYADRSSLSPSIKEELGTVAHLFKCIQKCMVNPTYFKEISVEGHRGEEEDDSVLGFFTKTFPGLVLTAFDLLKSLPDGRTKNHPISPTIQARRKSLHNGGGGGDFNQKTKSTTTSSTTLPTKWEELSSSSADDTDSATEAEKYEEKVSDRNVVVNSQIENIRILKHNVKQQMLMLSTDLNELD